MAKSLSASGFQDPTSESASATHLLTEKFQQGDVQLLIVVSTPDGVDSAPARAVGNEIVDQLRSSPHVAQVTSPWTAPPPAAADLVSRNRTSALIVAGINGDESRAAEVRQGVVRPGGARPRRRHRPVGWNRDGQRPDHRAVAARPAADGVAGDPAEFSRAGLGFRRPGGRRAAGGRRCDGDPRRTRGSAVDLVCHRRVDLRPQPHHRDGSGAGDRLHAADDQPVPRRVGRRREPRRRAGANDGVGRPHRGVLRDDGRAVDGGPGAVPDALPEVVRLRRRRNGHFRRGRRNRGDTRRAGSAR